MNYQFPVRAAQYVSTQAAEDHLLCKGFDRQAKSPENDSFSNFTALFNAGKGWIGPALLDFQRTIPREESSANCRFLGVQLETITTRKGQSARKPVSEVTYLKKWLDNKVLESQRISLEITCCFVSSESDYTVKTWNYAPGENMNRLNIF